MSPVAIALLACVALVAGAIDAIAGGGGMLTVPALLLVSPDPRLALGTNKGQAVFGSFASLASFVRAKRVDGKRALPTFLAALVGAVAGVRLVFALDPQRLRPIVLGLLVAVAVVFAYKTRPGARETTGAGWPVARRHPGLAAAVIGFTLGLYDGFFGPGTGTFLIAAYVTIFGDELTAATANAKVSNFASNLASVVLFAIAGKIDFRVALPMAAAQTVGAWLGARAAIRVGRRLVRAGVLVVTAALVARLAWQIVTGQ